MHSVLAPLVDFRLSGTGALLVVLYAVAIGGAIGSFLNVVAYRLPLGMNLSRPGSRCPRCKRPIRPWHNVPVLGWLMLRGRCRDCGTPISPRYPIVELLVGVASAIVVWKSLVPVVESGVTDYSLNTIAVVLRLGLLYLLFTSVLLEFDGSPLPLRVNLGAAIVLATLAVLLPELRPPQPLSGGGLSDGTLANGELPPIAMLAFPAAASVVLALVSWPLLLLPPSAGVANAVARGSLLLLVGLVLGGLAVMFVALAAAALTIVAICLRSCWQPASRTGWAIAVLVATLLWVVIAGPHLGSNEMLIVGDVFIVPDLPWRTLVAVGVLTAGLAATGRFGHGMSIRLASRTPS